MSKERFESNGQMDVELSSTGYECLIGGGAMGALMRAHDWSQTPFGSVEQWSQSLRSTLSICLNSRFPIAIYWGTECLLLYNDAWRPILGDKHPWALGRPGSEVWSEIWNDVGPELASVLATGEGIFHSDELLSMHRFGYTEECYFDYTFNPIQGVGGVIDGVLNIVSETTYRVLNDRRARLLREMASQTGTAKTTEEACASAIEALRSDPADIPFALLYLIDQDGQSGHLCGSTECHVDHSVAPTVVDLAGNDSDSWSIARVARTGQPQVITDVMARFGVLPGSPWAEPPIEAIILPISGTGQGKVAGVLVAVASPRRKLDENYSNFMIQVAGQIGTAIVNSRSYEEERQRAEQLAELDRAKTVFFSNVSHEFRTPLTLMLGPLEDALASLREREEGRKGADETTASTLKQQLQLAQRSALRLQKLVNTLLDFSRIEAGRIEAVYQPTDLAMLTTDLAGMFRSAIERAGLQLQVDCPPLPEPVYVDREMWEKIVLNLLSNAFKFTFEGEIRVSLFESNEFSVLSSELNSELSTQNSKLKTQNSKSVTLEIRDTGTGIPAAELPHIFERFRRVKGARGRSYEGSGIGLSLVQELVKLHGGTVTVSSTEGKGTCFTVCLPMGSAHLPADRIAVSRSQVSTAMGAIAYVEEAQRWLPTEIAEEKVLSARESVEGKVLSAEITKQEAEVRSRNDSKTQSSVLSTQHSSHSQPTTPARILLADDNADMREYIKRLLSQSYEVEAVTNGREALVATQRQLPNLVLTDVMMPEMDGFELLRSLRSHPQTQVVPVILLSARAGEEAHVEGLAAGADDYLTKPFSARELIARVEAALKLAQLRQVAMQQEQALRQEAEAAQQQVETILASISDGFFVLDRDWRYTYANDRLCEMAGKQREELLGYNNWEVFPEAVGTDVYVQFHQALQEQTPCQFEYLYLPWNRWFEYRVYPSPDGLTIFAVEVTDRKQVEQTLQQTYEALEQRTIQLEQANANLQDALEELQVTEEEIRQQNTELAIARETAELEGYRYQDLFNFAPDGYVVTDARGIIQEANQAIAALLALEQSYLVNTPLAVYAYKQNRRVFRNLLYELHQHPELQKLQTEEVNLISSKRNAIPVAITVTAMRDNQMHLVGARWLIQDITSRKQAELERERLLKAEQQARAAAEAAWEEAQAASRIKDEFLAVLSHELRSPLNPILGWTKLLQSRQLEPVRAKEALAVIERNAKLQAQLIDDLLDISRIIRGKLTLNTNPVSLPFVISSALETVRLSAEAKQIQIETILEPGVESVIGDAARLQQVVWNLLSNAIKFTPAGGRVEVRLESFEFSVLSSQLEDPTQNSKLKTQNSYACITVTDTGKGISPQFLPHLFEYFRQEDASTTRQFGGLGLGLAIARQIVEMHGGTIHAESQGEGQGATFIVRLPLQKDPSETVQEGLTAPVPANQATSLRLSDVHVLVVDDDSDTLMFYQVALESAGATVTPASSAMEAMQCLAQETPDVLLSDIGMPNTNGYMLMQQIKAAMATQDKLIPAIALTAYATDRDRELAFSAGFQAHLPKPVDPESLVTAIVQLLN